MAKELKHINRPLTDEQRQQAETIRSGVQKEFPPQNCRSESHHRPESRLRVLQRESSEA